MRCIVALRVLYLLRLARADPGSRLRTASLSSSRFAGSLQTCHDVMASCKDESRRLDHAGLRKASSQPSGGLVAAVGLTL